MTFTYNIELSFPSFLIQAKGMLSELDVGSDGRATFRFDNGDLKVWELIGRSVIIHHGTQPTTNNR